MATVGFDKLYYAPITAENPETGEETYGDPVFLAKAISAGLSVELAEAVLYADDAADETIKEFKSAKLSLGVKDIGKTQSAKLTGAQVDDNGVLVSASEDGGDYVAVGFRAKLASGKYRLYWLYKVKFAVPSIKDSAFLRKQNHASPSTWKIPHKPPVDLDFLPSLAA